MNVQDVVVEFANNRSGSYIPDELIVGNVQFKIIEDVKIKGILLKFKGDAHVAFTDGFGRDKTHHSADEVYFNTDIILLGRNRKHGDCPSIMLCKGDYDFPFEFKLPPGIPPSYATYHGSIRYSIKFKIDMPKFHSDFRKTFPFTVLNHIDLNSNREFMQPFEEEGRKTLWFLGCATGSVFATLKLERRGYAEGEKITVFADIHNNSTRRVKQTQISLYQMKIVSTSGSCKVDHQNIFKYDHGEILPGMSDCWNGEQLSFYCCAPSILGCKIIEINYWLKLTAKLDGCLYDLCSLCNLNIRVPIIIGTKPLQPKDKSHHKPEDYEAVDMNDIPLHHDPQIITAQPQPLPSNSASIHMETTI